MAIFEEQTLEPFVSRGIGNSGVASRQIQATNLPSLSASIRESAATQENLNKQQRALNVAQSISQFNSKLPDLAKSILAERENQRPSISNINDDSMNPFVVGQIKQGQFSPGGAVVAIPDGRGGYVLKTAYTKPSPYINDDAAGFHGIQTQTEKDRAFLKAIGVEDFSNAPLLSISGISGKRSKQELLGDLMRYFSGEKNSPNISNILKRIQSGS